MVTDSTDNKLRSHSSVSVQVLVSMCRDMDGFTCKGDIVDNIVMKYSVFVSIELLIFLCFISRGLQNKIIFSINGSIIERDLLNDVVSTLVSNLQSNIYSLDYDYKTGYVFFPRHNKNDILRFRYPSETAYSTKFVAAAREPIALVIDPLLNHVYWTEIYQQKIYRCDFDGTNKISILQDDQLYAITLDYVNSWLYYSTKTNKIRRYRLTSGEKQTVKESVDVTGLGIDAYKNRLYWMEYQRGDLESSELNGTNSIKVVSTNKTRTNIGIYVYGSKIYCSNGNQILKVTVSPITMAEVIHTDTAGINSVLFYYGE
ncbi:unnamed protein product [Mytilus edulis]|uniref:Uncharacterized protein n=1 Tax=Mytilus edulis TaxID=6550 RepID=A0A8S3SWN9_MYTED|nr:unnamed protein product [Mytilus edulis]